MSGKDSFLEDERKNIEKTVIMIEHLTEKTDLSKYEVIALGTLLQNIYTGIEGIIRRFLPRFSDTFCARDDLYNRKDQ